MSRCSSQEGRYWAQVDRGLDTDDDCWTWQGALNKIHDGYGYLIWDGTLALAHRVSWAAGIR